MRIRWENPEQVIHRFEKVHAALIDASSVIYARKAGFFELLRQAVQLYGTPEILLELGEDATALEPIVGPSPVGSNDQRLVQAAADLGLPLISEDKHVLRAARNAAVPFFNALVMLNYLLWARRVDRGQFDDHLVRLKQFAWYAPEIWKYSQRMTDTISTKGGVPC